MNQKTAAIALGSNLTSPFGNPAANLREATRRLASLGEVKAVSSFYETDPVGYLDQPCFINAAALLETTLEPVQLIRELLAVERAMGRDRTGAVAKGPRVIDLDLLLYGVRVISTPELTLPHPAMHERRFVLEPLAEIAPTMMHPVLRFTVQELLQRLK
ncbi:2-amino-4-hydroxy-6-hydroxymethyldihydropteridine diphosphokinase [Edaphobacter bradus]|uniref:2-amino-4-hydroxy-6- hydroxymethyldihydropteridine diphosphokinase n=1 Tax=Edaphobacter bradus TaxID=2259016 RepID=UPI0021E0325B|nr:2-amino-4-hydroxy-6-hydroxymethyldihydropteridine diphosphokinase [Edaphobacter bradus]